jgi:hypothetical protein
MRERDQVAKYWARTYVAVYEPTIRGSSNSTSNPNETMLLRPCEKRSRGWVSLVTKNQCEKTKKKLRNSLTPGPKLVVLFVLTHTTSSHLRYPHLAKTSLPLSNPSPAPLPTHMKTKEGSAARDGMGRSCRSSQVNDDENGGSRRMTSNLHGSKDFRDTNGK